MIQIDLVKGSPYLVAFLSLILFLVLVRRQKRSYETSPRVSLRRNRSQSFIAKALGSIADRNSNYKPVLTVMRDRVLDLEAGRGVRAGAKRFLRECERMESREILTRKEFMTLYKKYTCLIGGI